MNRGSRRLVVVVTAVALAAPAALLQAAVASPSRAGVTYPAYATVRHGNTLWSIARDFLGRAQDGRVTPVMTKHEVQQIEVLNRDRIKDADRIYAGERLLLAPSSSDLPDGRDGWRLASARCRQSPFPTNTSTPGRDWTFRIRVPDPPVEARRYARSEPVELLVRNGADRARGIDIQDGRAQLFDADGRPHGGIVWTDVKTASGGLIEPGQTLRMNVVSVTAYGCGDTRYLSRPLPSGRYNLYGFVHWFSSKGDGLWVSAPNKVRVVR
jgi:hypothetical protein